MSIIYMKGLAQVYVPHYDPKGHSDQLHDPNDHGDLRGQFDLDFDPKRSLGH